MLLVLFVPDKEVVFRNDVGAELAGNAHRFVSRLAADRFLGHLRAQKAAMTRAAGVRVGQWAPDGYDAKHAMHALRLGWQGIELMTAGHITLPVPEPGRRYLRSIRRGEVALAEVIDAITSAETELGALRGASHVPGQPDRHWVDEWLHRSYLDFWAASR